MTAYTNWISNSTNTAWKHRHNHNVIVAIVKTPRGYNIFHSHPGPHGTAIMQEFEVARSMKSARERAEKHLSHWSNYKIWKQDGDFGRLGARGA
jgi:hypothetical protein